jgi:pimeloyl-[acyl-carrier protein] synthase
MDERELIAALFQPAACEDPGALLAASGVETCRYEVVNAALRDASLLPPPVSTEKALWRMFGRWMISLHGERHQRMRSRFSGLFGPRQAPGFRVSIEARTEALIDGMVGRGEGDLVTDLAHPLPFSVICDVLGVPEETRTVVGERLSRMSRGFAKQRDPAVVDDASEAVEALMALFSDLLDERAARPRDDLLSALAAELPADMEERADLAANCIFLMDAGHSTTTSLIAGGVLRLIERPDVLAAVREGRVAITGVVEELLRLLSPVTVAPRCVPGQPMRMYFLAGANRDPAVFPNPGELDPSRDPNPHLAFSAGRHFCLGAPLGRLHGEIAIPAVLRRLPNLRRNGAPEWRGAIPLHELEHLPVAWDPP